MAKYKEILKYRNLNFSKKQIAEILSTSRNTITKVYNAADENNLDWIKVSSLDEVEITDLLFPKKMRESQCNLPDYEYVHKEMLKKGVTLKLLWEEYVVSCQQASVFSLQYSQFCYHYNKYKISDKATMHFTHFPGQRIEVDWAGTTMPIYPLANFEPDRGYLFVATLPYSQYSYAELCEDMKQENWINAHINMVEYFNGVTPMIYPDNLKTGVISNKKGEEAVINKAFEEFANYYGTVIVPTAPRTPKGKPSVESSVGKVTTQIIAKLRNHKFRSVYEANQAIINELELFNNAKFQKREGSRSEVFERDELPTLIPLPKIPYEYAVWKTATVQFNYHIVVEKNYYSVPYEYIRNKVDIRITKTIIEIYYKQTRLTSHSRLFGKNMYSSKEHHMPEKHQKALEWSGDRIRKWASKIGNETHEVIDRLLKSKKVEQQMFKTCINILKLQDKFTNENLENACRIALNFTSLPNYNSIKSILETNQETEEEKNINDNEGAFVRGANYFGGKKDE